MNINAIFDEMDYGSTVNTVKEAREWLSGVGGVVSAHVAGRWALEVCVSEVVVADASSDDSSAALATLTYADHLVDFVLKEASSVTADFDHNCLQRFADILAKKSNLAAGLEALSTGRSIGRLINSVLPQSVEWLRHLASKRLSGSSAFQGNVVIAVPSDASLITVVRQIGPMLMAKHRIILVVSKENSEATNRINLALFYLAEIALEANFPKGSFNVIYGVGLLTKLATKSPLDTYQIHVDTEQDRVVAGSGFGLISIAKSQLVFVVCDSCDVNGATEAVVRAIVDSTQEKIQLKLFVQESIQSTFEGLLRSSLGKLRRGNCVDPSTDISAESSKVIDVLIGDRSVGWVDTGLVSLEAFRTLKEVAQLVNRLSHRVLRLSLWTELIAVALELSDEVVADTVWVNCYGDQSSHIDYQHPRTKWCLGRGEVEAVSPRVFLKPVEALKAEASVVSAVNTCAKAQLSWKKLSVCERVRRLASATGPSQRWDEVKTFVEATQLDAFLNSLNNASQYAERYVGRILSSTSFKGKILSTIEPVGVVAAVLSDDLPLSSLALLLLPALLAGNAVLLIANATRAPVYTLLIKLLGLPAGVLSWLEDNGDPQQAINTLCHTNVRSMTYFGGGDVNFPLPPHSATLTHVRVHNENNTLDQLDDEMSVGQRKLLWLPSGVTFAT